MIFNEKGWNAYKIWEEHPSFECSRMAVYNLIKKIKEIGRVSERRKCDRPVTATTEENASFLRSLFVRKKMNLVPTILSGKSQLVIDQQIISSSLGQEKNLHCYKRSKTSQMNSACRKSRAERAGKLLRRFSIHSLSRFVFQDEKDFSPQVPTNCQNYSEGNKFRKRL